MEMSGRFYAPAPLSPGKEPAVPIGYETWWALEAVWMLWSREKSYPCRELNPGRPASNLSLYRLSYPSIMFHMYNNVQ
jgi:hypothetical protein